VYVPVSVAGKATPNFRAIKRPFATVEFVTVRYNLELFCNFLQKRVEELLLPFVLHQRLPAREMSALLVHPENK